MSQAERVTLSALDLLGLTKQRKVARIDLASVGYQGVLYVRDLTAAEQAKIVGTAGRSGKARFYNDKSYEMPLDLLAESSGPKFLMAAVVTDTQDGALLERAFAAAGEDEAYVTMSAAELVQMADTWVREAGNVAKAEKALEAMPNAISNLVVKRVRELSGMGDDPIEEKKENS